MLIESTGLPEVFQRTGHGRDPVTDLVTDDVIENERDENRPVAVTEHHLHVVEERVVVFQPIVPGVDVVSALVIGRIDLQHFLMELTNSKRVVIDAVEHVVLDRRIAFKASFRARQTGRGFSIVYKNPSGTGPNRKQCTTALTLDEQPLRSLEVFTVPEVMRIAPNKLQHHVRRDNTLDCANSFHNELPK